MNNITVDEVIEEILEIERKSIKKRRQIVSTNTIKYGRNKADADVVNEILAKIEAGGIGNEDYSY